MINRFTKVFRVQPAAMAIMALSLAAATAHAGTVPAVVAETAVKYVPGGYVFPNPVPSPSPSPTTFVHPFGVASDANGNLFVTDSGYLWEVAAGTTTPTLIYSSTAGSPVSGTSNLGGNTSVAIDAAGDVIVTGSYDGGVYVFANTNGKISSVPTNINNIGGLDGYFASMDAVAVVNQTQVYTSVYHTNALGNATEIFTYTTAGKNAAVFLLSLPGGLPALQMAGDNASHLYYSDGTNAYSVNTAASSPSPVLISVPSLGAVGGVSVDASGNLYLTDKTNSRVVKVPNENGTLNTADAFVVAVGVYTGYNVGVDPLGNLYYTDAYNTNSLWKITLGSTQFATTATGAASANASTNFIFNAAATPTAVGYYQGTGTSKEFTAVSNNCVAAHAAISYCTATSTFKPTQAGARTGAIVLVGTGNKALGTAYLYGVGSGAAVTIDPGTQSTLAGAVGASYNSPSAAAFDGAGNLYVADARLNTVLVTPAGGTAATVSLSKNLSLTLSAPDGVTVDAAGNVFIADTGNSRIVEVPDEAGTLNPADATVVGTTSLKAPTGVRASLDGSLYVVDSGNARVLRLATYGGLGDVFITTVGSGFIAPTAVTTDSAGIVYVSDGGTGGSTGTITSVNPLTNIPAPLLSQLSAPGALAVDAAGDLYYINGGNKTVQMIPDVAGTLATGSNLSLGAGVITPTGLAVDVAGNVAIADGGGSTVYKLARTTGAVNFGNINIGLTSTAQQETLTSTGNLPLIFSTPYAVVTGNTVDFQQQAPATECASAASLPTGKNCVVSVIFAPVAINALSETYTFSTNAANAASSTAVFSGFATNLSLTNTALTMTPTAPTFGQTVTVTASVSATRAGYTPTGTVAFYLDGNKAGTSNVVNGSSNLASFVFSLAAGNQLSAGTHMICASYSGDMSNAASTSAQCLNFSVTKSTAAIGLTVLPTTIVSPGSTLYFSVLITPAVAYAPQGSVQLVAVSGTTSTPISASVPLTTATTGSTSYAQIPVLTSATAGTGLLSVGQYQIVAVYTGDVNFSSNTSQGVNVSVQTPGYTVATTNSNLTVEQGSSVSTTLTITTHGGYGGDTYTPATGITTASSSVSIVQYLCSTLPSNAKCVFSPGFAQVNSYNQNEPCAALIASNASGAQGTATTVCAYNPYTGGCLALASNATSPPPSPFVLQNYCSDPNFSNTYAVILTIQTDVIPPTAGGMGGGVLGLLCAAMLGCLLRRRRQLSTALLLLVAMVGLGLGALGCGTGSGKNPIELSPAGTSNFTVTFQGQTGTSTAPPFVVQTLPMSLTITK